MSMRHLINLIPSTLRARLYRTRLRLYHPELVHAMNDYAFTDERLKMVNMLECMNYLRIAGADGSIPPVFFEFGCHSGRTFSAAVNAAKYLGMEDAEFYAFDSFEGLPATVPEDDGYFEGGTFSTSRAEFIRIVQRKTGYRLPDRNIIQGFYSRSLTAELRSAIGKVGVVHIDVDLYSSTKELLAFIKPLMVIGTVLAFDDWYCFASGVNKGEIRALREFCEDNPSFRVEEWKAYSTFGKSFFVTALPSSTLGPS